MVLFFNAGTQLYYKTRIAGSYSFLPYNKVLKNSWNTTVDDNTRTQDFIEYGLDGAFLYLYAGDAINKNATNQMKENDMKAFQEVAPEAYKEIHGQKTQKITIATIIAAILVILVLKKLLKKNK